VARAEAVGTPTLVIHGTNDEIVPFAHGIEVHGILSKGSISSTTSDHEFLQVRGAGHNDVLTTNKSFALEALMEYAMK